MKHFIAFYFSSFPLFFFAQKLDRDFYLLGVTDQYMGRCYALKDPALKGYVLRLNKEKINEIKRIENVTQLKFESNAENSLCGDCSETSFLINSDVEEKINLFFKFQKRKFKADDNYFLYCGLIEKDKILAGNKIQLYSFLAGVFLMHGKLNSSDSDLSDNEVEYEISIANSKELFETTKEVLNKLAI